MYAGGYPLLRAILRCELSPLTGAPWGWIVETATLSLTDTYFGESILKKK
jgi:hypothetical protein